MFIPENTYEASVNILIHPYSMSLGTYKMPDGYELASPVYCVQPSNDINFTKDVILELHHYANLQTEEDCTDMAFVSAPLTSQKNTYIPFHVFQKINRSNSSFSIGNGVGKTTLRHFSLFGTVRRRIRDIILGKCQ